MVVCCAGAHRTWDSLRTSTGCECSLGVLAVIVHGFVARSNSRHGTISVHGHHRRKSVTECARDGIVGSQRRGRRTLPPHTPVYCVNGTSKAAGINRLGLKQMVIAENFENTTFYAGSRERKI